MPADALTYAFCAKELNTKLSGGRINKIAMPQPDTLILHLRSQGQNLSLTISANASFPRLHLTKASPVNPPVAPSFLMHLRKHIGSGSIEEVSTVPFERIITIKIKAYNELMIPESKKLIVEIMGKHSNIILVNEKDIISDSIKHITADISGKRQVLSGLPYHFPPVQTEKINVSQTEIFKQKLQTFEGGNLEKFLQGFLSGLAVASIKEAVFRAKVQSESALSEQEITRIITEFNALYDFTKAKPCALKSENNYSDFFISPYLNMINASDSDSQNQSYKTSQSDSQNPLSKTSQSDLQNQSYKTSQTTTKKSGTANSPNSETSFVFFDCLNDAMDACYGSIFTKQISTDKRSFLLAVIKSSLSKNQKKLGTLMQKQHDALDYEDDRKKADLILSNLYRIRKGDTEIEVEDFFNDNLPFRITIDEHKSPQANAQIFYKNYNKKKTTLNKLEPFIDELNANIEYLDNLAYFAEASDNENEFIEIAEELIRLGYLKKKTTAKKNDPPKQDKREFVTYSGYRIFIGKSSVSNDALVRKSQPDFVWLHASAIHGSHVVIENHSDKMPPNDVLLFAAQIAAYYSKARQSENVPVDYTFIRNVKKPRGALPGKVIFTEQKTLFVSPKKPEINN